MAHRATVIDIVKIPDDFEDSLKKNTFLISSVTYGVEEYCDSFHEDFYQDLIYVLTLARRHNEILKKVFKNYGSRKPLQ